MNYELNNLNFIIVSYLVCLMSFNINAEQPLSICLSEHPFRLLDSSCGSFEEICIKKGDENCDTLKNACKQCPPTNYTSFMLMDILKVAKSVKKTIDINQLNDKNDFNLSIRILLNQYKSIKDQLKEIRMNILEKMLILKGLIILLLVTNILFIIMLVLEIRYKILSKCILRWNNNDPNSNNLDTPLIEGKRRNSLTEIKDEIIKAIQIMNKSSECCMVPVSEVANKNY